MITRNPCNLKRRFHWTAQCKHSSLQRVLAAQWAASISLNTCVDPPKKHVWNTICQSCRPILIVYGMFIISQVSCTSQHWSLVQLDIRWHSGWFLKKAGTKTTASVRVKCPGGTQPFWPDWRVASGGATTCLLGGTSVLIEHGFIRPKSSSSRWSMVNQYQSSFPQDNDV